jgi:hypothetical protein
MYWEILVITKVLVQKKISRSPDSVLIENSLEHLRTPVQLFRWSSKLKLHLGDISNGKTDPRRQE